MDFFAAISFFVLALLVLVAGIGTGMESKRKDPTELPGLIFSCGAMVAIFILIGARFLSGF